MTGVGNRTLEGTYLTSGGEGAVDIEENEFLDRPISESGRNHRAGVRRRAEGLEQSMRDREVDGRREEGDTNARFGRSAAVRPSRGSRSTYRSIAPRYAHPYKATGRSEWRRLSGLSRA